MNGFNNDPFRIITKNEFDDDRFKAKPMDKTHNEERNWWDMKMDIDYMVQDDTNLEHEHSSVDDHAD